MFDTQRVQCVIDLLQSVSASASALVHHTNPKPKIPSIQTLFQLPSQTANLQFNSNSTQVRTSPSFLFPFFCFLSLKKQKNKIVSLLFHASFSKPQIRCSIWSVRLSRICRKETILCFQSFGLFSVVFVKFLGNQTGGFFVLDARILLKLSKPLKFRVYYFIISFLLYFQNQKKAKNPIYEAHQLQLCVCVNFVISHL